MLLAGVAPAYGGELPPPPQAGSVTHEGVIPLYLELIINQQSTGLVVPVQMRGGQHWLNADTLRAHHVRTDAHSKEWVAVDNLAGVSVRYDSIKQQLELNLPPEWLPTQTVGDGRPHQVHPILSGAGLLFNYDLHARNLGQADSRWSLWNEQRWFGSLGVLSNTGVLQDQVGQAGSTTPQQRYLRYDTTWRYADVAKVRAFTVGDLTTGSLPWGRAVRMGGVQVARSFSVRPDLVPFPVPAFAGEAAVPTAVDLFINGQRAASEKVQAGPFILNTLPYVSGAGEAAIVTTDALGRQVQTLVPFYVASNLLKAGTNDYSLSVGAVRRAYGLRNFAYGPPAASAHLRHGLTDHITLEARTELAPGTRVLGVGAMSSLYRWGVIHAALSQGGSGWQGNVGYQYQTRGFGLSLQHQQHTGTWRDLSTLEAPVNSGSGAGSQPVGRSHRSVVAVSATLGNAGSAAFGYIDSQHRQGFRYRVASASWSRAAGRRGLVSAQLFKTLDQGGVTAQLQWTWMLGNNGSLSTQVAHRPEGLSAQAYLQRAVPVAGGLGWSLAQGLSADGTDSSQASAAWRGQSFQVDAGATTYDGRSAGWAGVNGSVVAMDGGWFAANRISDSFALVATGVPDVLVRYESQAIGRTNARGHLLVTGITSHYPARFEIDTLELPEFMQARRPEQRAQVYAGRGGILRFEIDQLRAATVTLHDEDGRPLPVGATVEHQQSGERNILGWGSLVYLSKLHDDNVLIVRLGPSQQCTARFVSAKTEPGISRIGPLTCKRVLPLRGEPLEANLGSQQ